MVDGGMSEMSDPKKFLIPETEETMRLNGSVYKHHALDYTSASGVFV